MAKRVRLQGGRGRRIRAPKQSGAGFLILLRLRAKVWYPAVTTIRRVAELVYRDQFPKAPEVLRNISAPRIFQREGNPYGPASITSTLG
jgi:hypothetical protein